MTASLSKRELVEKTAAIHEELLKGQSDDEIMDLLGLSPEHYESVKRLMLSEKGALERSKAPEERFAEYQVAQQRSVRQLDELIRNLDTKSQYNALVGAMRLRHDIQRGVIDMGQTLGVIPKQAERREVFGGVVLADLSDKDLRTEILKTVGGMDKMVTRFGDVSFSDLAPGPTHYGPALRAAESIETEAVEVPARSKSVEKPKMAKTKAPITEPIPAPKSTAPRSVEDIMKSIASIIKVKKDAK